MKKLAPCIAFLIFGLVAFGQNSLSFYHLGNTTFQSRYFNPAFVPEGKVFIGLPVISGVHLNFNNKFSYSDIISQGEKQNEINLNSFLDRLQRNNMVSVSTAISLLHVGVTSPELDMHFSVFANEKAEVDFLYPKALMQFAIEGNASLVGQRLRIGNTRLSASYYREYGIGISKMISDHRLSLGANVKYLQGFVNASTPGNFTADLETDPLSYSIDLDMKNATLRTAGLGIVQGKSGDPASHLMSNANRGLAFDLGFSKKINRQYSIAGSIVDLGFISWQEDIKNYHIGDTTMSYSGIDLGDVVDGEGSLEQTFKDSLINRFKNKKTENANSYTSMLAPKVYLSASFDTPGAGDLVASVGSRLIQGQMKVMAGAGYRHSFGRMFIGTVNVTKLPQQLFNLGGAFTVNGGPVQMYVAVDQVVNFDATRFRALDVRFGFNLAFGENNMELKSTSGYKPARSSTDSFLGSKVKVKKKEGIYTIINRQQRRKENEFKQ